jgi:gamma-glutamyltranspeptidase/glutathione hydrolase
MFSRREFVGSCIGGGLSAMLVAPAMAQQSGRADHYATGSNRGVSSTSLQATEAALWALDQGGSAADAYIVAALTQTVCEPGLTSIGGAFGITYFNAGKARLSSVAGLLGPAEAEPYDFDRQSPLTQTGRAMPVPGFLAGVYEAHRLHGRLDWKQLFEPAIRHATEGSLLIPELIAAAGRKALKHPESKNLWLRDGRLLKADEPLVQTQLGRVLSAVAQDGPDAFYAGDFARHYVERAQIDGGRITLDDLKAWKNRIRVSEPEFRGNYRGHQVVSAPLIVYALHLNEALDLRSSGSAAVSPASVYRQMRIMEEVFLASRTLTKENEDVFVDPAHARARADFVLSSPRRELALDAIFNTCFLVVRDRDGNCAWGTHSINSPSPFGAGILVDGVYASFAINRDHVHGKGATAAGITTSYALFKDGQLRLVTGSPGYGFVHGPYQFGTGIVEWNLSPAEAMNLPRFSLPNSQGVTPCERNFDPKVLEMLKNREIKHQVVRPSTETGLVGALFVDEMKHLHFVQDGRRSGFARAT